MMGSDKVVMPRRVHYVALTADTSTTTPLDLKEVVEELFGEGADYRGYWRLTAAEDFYVLAGDADVPDIDLTVDNDGDEGWPVYAKEVESLACTGPATRFLKFRGGSAGTTLAICKG